MKTALFCLVASLLAVAAPPPKRLNPHKRYSISGNVSGSAATLTLSGAASGQTATDGSGNYSFGNLANGSYVVAPSQSGFTFSPSSSLQSVSNANITGINFAGTANPPQHTVRLDLIDDDANIAGFIYSRSTVSGSGYAPLNTALAGKTFTDSTVISGAGPYYYVADAIDINGAQSGHSPEAATGVIP